MADFNLVLQFWFEGITDQTAIQKSKPPFSLWFLSTPKFDQTVSDKFELDLFKAKRGDYKDWEKSPRGLLALIILFDQFSRNIHRRTAQAFATDNLAIDLAQRAIQKEFDQKLMLIERVFLYMPFMHSEKLSEQEEGVRQFQKLVEDSKVKAPNNTHYFEYNLQYSRQHRDIITKFGRFPHRNAVLKRAGTVEEEQFLKKPGSSF